MTHRLSVSGRKSCFFWRGEPPAAHTAPSESASMFDERWRSAVLWSISCPVTHLLLHSPWSDNKNILLLNQAKLFDQGQNSGVGRRASPAMCWCQTFITSMQIMWKSGCGLNISLNRFICKKQQFVRYKPSNVKQYVTVWNSLSQGRKFSLSLE